MKESSHFTRVCIFRVETNSRDSNARKTIKIYIDRNELYYENCYGSWVKKFCLSVCMNEFHIHFLQTCVRLFVYNYLSIYYLGLLSPFITAWHISIRDCFFFFQSFNHIYRAILLCLRVYVYLWIQCYDIKECRLLRGLNAYCLVPDESL